MRYVVYFGLAAGWVLAVILTLRWLATQARIRGLCAGCGGPLPRVAYLWRGLFFCEERCVPTVARQPERAREAGL